MTSRRSSGSMRAESAVEPTKSENITVTWRRSARSSGGALGALGRGRRVNGGRLAAPVVAQGSDGIQELSAVTDWGNAKLLQVLLRQARQNRLVYFVLAECSLVLSRPRLRSQTTTSMKGAHHQWWRASSAGAARVSRVALTVFADLNPFQT